MKAGKTYEHWVLIANSAVGGKRRTRIVDQVVRRLRESKGAVEVRWTTAPGHAEELAGLAVRGGATHVVACGGDGTIHEVVNGIVASEPATDAVTLGIVPLGRCNDLVRALNIPCKESVSIQTLLDGGVRTIDLGRVGGRYFLTVASLGLDSLVNQYVADGRPPRFFNRTTAYLYGIMANLFRYRFVRMRLQGDVEGFEGPVFLAAVGNTSTYGGGMKIAPTAVVDDGRLDLCLVRQTSRLDVIKMLPYVYSGGHVRHPSVTMHTFQEIEVSTEAPMTIWADGEPVARTPAVFRIVPRALRVLTPVGVTA